MLHPTRLLCFTSILQSHANGSCVSYELPVGVSGVDRTTTYCTPIVNHQSQSQSARSYTTVLHKLKMLSIWIFLEANCIHSCRGQGHRG